MRNILQSKTTWANVISLAAILFGMKGIDIDPETQTTIAAGAMAVVNLVMRLISSGPVSLTGK